MEPAPSALQRASNGRFRSLIPPNERPGAVLGVILTAAFVVELATGGPGRWGLSSRALSEGRFETLLTHMFSHGGLLHLLGNVTVLGGFAGPVVARFGLRPPGLFRFCLLFLLSGLSGAALYLLLNLGEAIPMVGASGAICGFWGASIRLPKSRGEPLRRFRDAGVLRGLRDFAVANVIFFAILAVASLGHVKLAWEAHVGGLLVGLFALPLFLEGDGPLAE